MRLSLAACCLLLAASSLTAAEWQPICTELIKAEKPGYGGLCGVLVDRTTGEVYVQLSDKGVYKSSDGGKSWALHGGEMKGRTEWPGCFVMDPTGKTKKLLLAVVYGAPIQVGATDKPEWQVLDKRSMHVDWCVADWTDPDLKLMVAFKHEAGGLLLWSTDGGKSFTEGGKGYSFAWVFDGKTACVAKPIGKGVTGPTIFRTTDAGATFHEVGNHNAIDIPRQQGSAVYWLVTGGIIKTTDHGATWTKVCDVKDAVHGPIFGKDEKHLFVLAKSGILESTDGGATWSAPTALPNELKQVGALSWLDYDPKSDTLYAMKMTSDLYRMQRGGK